jgi:hypothetical protein
MSRARLTRQRDRMLTHATDLRASAYRCADHDPERAELLRDMARDALADARAITDALDMLDAHECHINDERQMSLGGIA